MDWKSIREKYPLINKYTYLDTARTGSMSQGTANALKSHIDDFLEDGALHREDWIQTMESARQKAADLLHVDSAEVGFLTDVSTGMSHLANSLKKYRKVLLIKDDFPSVGIPWIRSGYDITWIPKEVDGSIDINRIEEALQSGIDVLAISWVQYNSGYRVNLEHLGSLCQQYGAKLIVDGTQGFCAYDVDPKVVGIDVFITSCFKWATAGYGITIVYIDANFHKDIAFQAGGWNSLVDFFGSLESEDNYKAGADLLELGHPKYSNIITLDHALSEFQEMGIEAVSERVNFLSHYLQESLKAAGVETLSNFSLENASGIRLMRGSKELFKKLMTERVMVTFRDDYFRLATHFYNEEEDVDRLIDCLGN